jgi:hypothetical protein
MHARGLSPGLALGLLLLAGASAAADLRTGAAAVECQSSKPPRDPRWWSFRLDVDGVRRQRCWYPGKPGKPKTELHWARQPKAERPGAAVQTPSEDPGALSDTCCWPPLEPEAPPPPTEPTFRRRWNDLLNDMAEPVTRWRGQLKDQQRFGE